MSPSPRACPGAAYASVFLDVTSGNINAATMMVAEKAAAMILEDAR